MNRREFFAAGAVFAQPPKAQPVEVRQDRQTIDVKIDGRWFTAYNYATSHAGTYRPFFHPVMGPNGQPITQNGEHPGSLRGHYWHRGLFVAHQRVNGVSFWEEREADCGRIVHKDFAEVSSGAAGRFVERLAWRDLRGDDLLEETRTVRVPHSPPGRRLLDISLHFKAARDVLFGATPYNLLACRVINAMCVLKQKQEYMKRFGTLVDFSPVSEGGRIVNSEGRQDDACRGERARWCDFSGPLGDGTRGGVAILDHPSNPRHPTPWHNWNNVTITASFTFHEPFALKEGGELRLAYRVLIHAGDARQADVAAEWKAFSESEEQSRERRERLEA